MIDIHAEHTFPLSRMREHVPSRPSPATAHRWAFKGLRGQKLETILIGGRRYTSREAVDRFLARRNERAHKSVEGTNGRIVEKTVSSMRASAIFG